MDIQNRKRKIDCDSNITESEIQSKYNTASFNTDDLTSLQTILENDVFQGRIPASDVTPHLLKWFRVIVRDSEKLRTFRQWVFSSPDNVKQELERPIECNSNNVVTIAPVPSSSSTSAPSSASSSASLSHLLTDDATSMDIAGSNMIVDKVPSESQARSMGGSSTGRFTPESTLINNSFKNSPSSAASNDQGLLHQLLQQQQQQIVLLQQLQRQPPSPQDQTLASQAATISISPKIGNAGTLVTVTLKGKPWHARTSQCSCSLGFTAANGNTSSSQRIPGGTEGDFLFMVPQINARTANTSLVVHFTLCTSPTVPIVCLDSFHYTLRERSLGGSTTSDEDSETASTGEDDVGSPPQAPSPVDSPNFVCPTPKQMMSIRERMLEHTQKGAHSSVRLTVIQQPTVRVVWKNRRLDVPFKLRIECADDTNSLTPQKLVVLAVVADHKGRLQIDAAENYAEDGGSQGVVNFSNLRMTKGTWGKEWNITFAAVVKSSINNPVVVGVSTACPIVVKTRKNPQVRHAGRVESSPKSPQFTFVVERKGSESPVPLKRHRVEDLLDSPPAPPPAQPARTMSHFDDMASLLAAAELKQQEMQEGHEEPADVPCLPAMKQNDNDHSFANFQNLVSYLDDIRQKRQVSLGILEQPPPKRDSKVLIVKKGKPFRTPFQLQLNSTALRHNPQNYVCVAVVRNDKGEEVAVRNNEVPFDWRGVACFAGLMVMKGTWGKAVQLTFEARWATKRDKNAPWASHTRVLVVSETSPTQLMCYTKDKKSPGAA